jgi:UrcA family protein
LLSRTDSAPYLDGRIRTGERDMKAIHIVIASALISGIAIKAVPAFAEPAAPAINVSIVQTADLDLSKAGDQRRLDIRLARAARAVCGPESNVDLAGSNNVVACRADVVARGREQADALIAAEAKDGIRLAAAR